MEFLATAIPDVVLITPRVFQDQRGYFLETWRRDLFEQAGIALPFVQSNQSSSTRHVLRGLHYQVNRPQGKLVKVISGRVFDVAVDLRRSSPTFGRWIGYELSADNHLQLWVPPGFAHGFLVLSALAEFEYHCTDYYSPEDERVIAWDDGDIGIDWPLTPGDHPSLSEKDRNGLSLESAELFP